MIKFENRLAGIGHGVTETYKHLVLCNGLLLEFAVTAEVIRDAEKTVTKEVSMLVI